MRTDEAPRDATGAAGAAPSRIDDGTVPGFRAPSLTHAVAVGAVTRYAARVWFASRRPGRVEVSCRRADDDSPVTRVVAEILPGQGRDNTCCVTLPVPGSDAALVPGTHYRFRAVHGADGTLLGEGRFETAPRDADSAPDRFSIALISCNQPFDDDGAVAAAGERMLKAMQSCLREHHTKLVLTVGDQMYTDYPQPLSLFDDDYFRRVAPRGRASLLDCTRDEVRHLLQQRYRLFWNVPGWRALHAEYPCYPILDDHELVDNWGSVPAHATARWAPFIAGARAAYHDYEGSRIADGGEAPRDFDYEVEYGPTAIYVLDLRSNRQVGKHARIFAADQLERFEDFLARHRDKAVLQVVLSVPAIHLPRWTARVAHILSPCPNEDFADRWSTAGHVADRDRVLALLHAHQRQYPHQRILLQSGDIHIACAHSIAWDDGVRPLWQFVSSGITNQVGPLTQWLSKMSILANRRLELHDGARAADVRLLAGTDGAECNPYTGLNFGLIEFRREQGGRYAMRLAIHGERDAAPVCHFRSDWQ
ncbi:MAG: alkaline phosphatase D family protein [Gammaproteobacteria bacterium]